jgi:peptidoglycan/xylan/chitin deacetylase (PgdA/CDA1 family)
VSRDPLIHTSEEPPPGTRPRPTGDVAEAGPATLELRPQVVDGTDWPDWVRAGEPIPLFTPPIPAHDDDGEPLAELRQGGQRRTAISRRDGRICFHFDPWAALEHVTAERHLPPYRSWATRLPSAVFRLPGPLRLAGHRLLAGGARDPGAVELLDDSLERLRAVVKGLLGIRTPPPWPGGSPPVVLTHDVDTADGLRAAPRVARVEERLGLRACFYVVGDRYPLDHALLDDLRAAGHEIGLHGARHDFRLAYLSPPRIARRLDRCRELVERHAVVGFRSPALLMSDNLAAELSHRFEYDSSVPDLDVHSLAGPRRGCASVFPFMRGGLLTLPPTLPLDDRLLLLGRSPSASYDAWAHKLAWIRRVGGMGLVATHTEPHLVGGEALLSAYRRLLEHVIGNGMLTMLPRQVARWWRDGDVEEADGPRVED